MILEGEGLAPGFIEVREVSGTRVPEVAERVLVEGSFVRPEGEYLDSRRRARHSSLIRIRENFVPEMLKSAEDI